jgi:rhodanese-related sulfurtransferase
MNKIIKTYLVFQAVSMLFIYSCEKNEDTTSETSYTDVMASRVQNDLIDDASISPYEAIFDVSPVFKQGHLPFATNAGSVEGLGDMLDQWDKSRTYLVYCHADGPAIAGAEFMEENGFSNVHRLEGNLGAWDEVSFLDIGAGEVKSKIDAADFEAIFDVSPHFNEEHIPGATNANSSAGGTDLSVLIEDLDKTKSYLVYCHADSPAMAGAQLMEDAGFENVYRLEGNFGAWVNAGYAP